MVLGELPSAQSRTTNPDRSSRELRNFVSHWEERHAQGDVAAARGARLKSALPPWGELAYAVKANAYSPVLAAIGEEVDGFEVASSGEVAAVRARPRPAAPRRLLAAGPGKTPALLDALVTAGADPTNAESAHEVDRIAASAPRAGRRVAVALRVNPARVPLTGALRMGGGAAPFGDLDALALGEEAAGALGLRLEATRLLLVAMAAGLAGAAIAVAGPVGFVGLMAPHAARRLVAGTHAPVLARSVMLGGRLMLGADLAARPRCPVDIPVGVVTAVIGGPYLLWLLAARR